MFFFFLIILFLHRRTFDLALSNWLTGTQKDRSISTFSRLFGLFGIKVVCLEALETDLLPLQIPENEQAKLVVKSLKTIPVASICASKCYLNF